MFCDYHLHSEFSFDSSEKIENICEKALICGVSEIAITDHAELPLHAEAPWPNFAKRSEVIRQCCERYAGRLVIRKGIEIGQPWRSSKQEREVTSTDPDFIIASVHELDEYPDPRKMIYTEENIPVYVNHYIKQMCMVADKCDYDVLGHVTYLFRFFPLELAEKYTPEMFLKEYEDLFRIVISRGKGIEVNCSGLRMPAIKNLLPSLPLLQLYRKLGGEIITVGSDGHSCRSAFSGLVAGYEALKEAGFVTASSFEKRSPVQYEIC